MAKTFEEPIFKPQRFVPSGKLFITITIALAVILIASALLDIFGARRELSHVLTQQAEALIAAIDAGSNKAVESYNLVEALTAERMLSAARLLEEMDYRGALEESFLAQTAERNNIFRINIFAANGDKVMSSFRGGPKTQTTAPADLMTAINKKGNDELVMGFRRAQFNRGQRFAVAKRRRKGGVIILNIDADDMLEFRKSIGLGKLLQDIAATEGIRYIVIQDSSRIVVATANVDSMSSIASDPFLAEPLKTGAPATRFINYLQEKTFEIVQEINPRSGTIIRVGMATQHVRDAERAAIIRALLSSLLLLILGAVGSSLLISSQNYKTLKNAYDRIESYTGSILENMTDGVIAVNSNGDITLVNTSAENMFQVSTPQIRGKQCSAEISSICPYLQESLTTGKNKIHFAENIRTNKGERIANISVNIVKSRDDRVYAVFAVVKDVSDQKRLEENLKRKNRITAMGHLASGVAHEIRNPLNAIGMIAQRLKAEFTPKNNIEEYVQLTSTVIGETRRINEIIRQFLQFTRPGELNKQPVNIGNLLQQTAILIESPAKLRGVKVIQHMQQLPDIYADAGKLKQAFLNIAQNAVAACTQGDSITIAGRHTADSIIIDLSDTGRGMSQENLNKIFNLYFTTKESGSGIGLSVVQQIISQHDGTIEVQSVENQGTTFTITLPKNRGAR